MDEDKKRAIKCVVEQAPIITPNMFIHCTKLNQKCLECNPGE